MSIAGGGIPFFLTAAHKEALRAKGYSDSDIFNMKPEDGHAILGNGSAAHAPNLTAEVVIFEKNNGALTKYFEIVDGQLVSDSSACSMANGSARRAKVDLGNMASLAALINGLGVNEAYAIGRLRADLPDNVRIVVADKLARFRGRPDVIARNQEHIVFTAGSPALCLLDIDLKAAPESVKRLAEERRIWDAFVGVIPQLATTARVIRASTSFGLRNAKTGATYPSSGGFHAAIAVLDGSDIPRFLETFCDRLWLAGLGWGMLSAAGSFLVRALADVAVGTPERLIFEGPPTLAPPLEQAPRLARADEGDLLDTRLVCPPLSAEEQVEVERLKEAERLRLKPAGEAQRATWSKGHVERLVKSGMPASWAKAQVDRWIDTQELSDDFPLPFDRAELFGATVAAVLARPNKYINQTLSDPIEGMTYGKGKARLYRRPDGSLLINSFAHGGCKYTLKAAPRPDIEAEVERLALLPALDYDLARVAAAKRLGIRISLLDKAVEEKRRALNPPDTTQADAILDELNRDHSVILIGGRCRVLRFENTPHLAGGERYMHRLPTYVRCVDFNNFYMNRFAMTANGPVSIGQWWLEHPKRRQHSGVILLPGGPPIVDDRLNLWTGWSVEPKQGEWGRMQEHIFEVLAAGDDAVHTYILNWLADCVQRPGQQGEAALVFLGGQGTGRGVLGRAMCRIFGAHGRHISSPEHLTGRFNSHLQQCCFLFADEAVAPQDKKAEGALKRLITEPTLHIEPKGVDPFETPNFLHVMQASNHDWVVAAGERERRHVIQKVADTYQQQERWFAPIYAEMSAGGLGAMLFDLLARPLGDWRPRQVVHTAALAEQQDESLSPLDAWLISLLHSGELSGVVNVFTPDTAASSTYEEEDKVGVFGVARLVKREGLYDQARRVSPRLKGVTDHALGRFLRKLGCENVQVGTDRHRGWRFPPLPVLRDAWCKRFPHTDWGGGPADWTAAGVEDEV